MPNLRDIRKRIRSVHSTAKITRAMKLVAAAKLRRAQDAAIAGRPYTQRMRELIEALARRSDVSREALYQPGESNAVLVVVVSADRGLCGGFNSNVLKLGVQVAKDLQAAGKEPQVYAIGRRGADFFRRRPFTVYGRKVNLFAKLDFAQARELAQEMVTAFLEGKFGEVILVHNEFKSAMAPRLMTTHLLPLAPPPGAASSAEAAAEAAAGAGAGAKPMAEVDYIYEPDAATILDKLLVWHVNNALWHVLLESWAAEQAARMTAMDTATRNAGDMIDSLTLYMNKVRQASITRELIEVVSGASAQTG